MTCTRFALTVLLLVPLAGCRQERLEEIPETPPPEKGPELPSEASLRPLYNLGEMQSAAGTAFLIADRSGKLFMATAVHVLDNAGEWNSVKSAALRVMGGPVVARVSGQPVYLGKPFDKGDATDDFVFWPIESQSKLTPLKLAAADPKKNEWVWVVGQEGKDSGPQKLYRCKVQGAEQGAIILAPHDKFEPRGFSGGPIVNAQGEVIGTVLGFNPPNLIASKVSSLRQRLTEAKIELP